MSSKTATLNPRVYYIEPIGGHRGMHYYDFELCPALSAAGTEVTLLTCAKTEAFPRPETLSITYPFKGIYGDDPKWKRGLRYLRGLWRSGRDMHRHNIHLAHIHYYHFPPFDYLFLRWLKHMGKKIVITAHDVIPFDAKDSDLPWLHRLYSLADGIIVHAQANKQVMLDNFTVPDSKIQVIPMGPYLYFADQQAIPRATARTQLGLPPTAPVVLFFGQIKKVKGLQYLIQAFKHTLTQHPQARLVIAGAEWKDSFEGYDTLIAELGIGKHILKRIEYIPEEDVGIYFSAATLVVLPYTDYYQSAVLQMAYSFNRPVVVSAVGGLPEVVEDGKTGLIVPPGRVEALAQAIHTILQDQEKAHHMGQQGREFVKTHFSWEKIGQQITTFYKKLILST